MKKSLFLIFVLAFLALAIFCANQTHKSSTQQAELASLQNAFTKKTEEVETLQSSQQQAERQRHELMAQIYQLTAQVNTRGATAPSASNSSSRRPSLDHSPSAPGPHDSFSTLFSKMMDDPDTRELVRATQKNMIEQLYGPLIRKLNLGPEQGTALKGLLTDHMMNAAQKLASGSPNGSELIASASADQKALDDQVRALLGEDRYTQYKEYQESAAQRMQLTAFKQQLGGEDALTEEQSDALVRAMKDAQKISFANTAADPNSNEQNTGNILTGLSEQKMSELLQTQQVASQQVYESARSILSARQLDAFGTFQTNQMQMMQLGMNMTRKMFGPVAAPPAGVEIPR